MKHILISVIHIIIPKCVVLKNVHKMKSGQINHGMRGIQQFSGNAICQKGLANAGVTVKEKIPGLLIEMINEIVTGTENGLDILSGTDAEAAVLRIASLAVFHNRPWQICVVCIERIYQILRMQNAIPHSAL